MRHIVLLALLILLAAKNVSAQSADNLYEAARKVAFDDKDYPKAIELSKKALQVNPAYTDIQIFIARLYTWNKQPDSGRIYFQEALKQKPDAEDAYAGYADLEFWNDNDEGSLAVLHQGLQYHPSSIPLLLRKARILQKKREFQDALAVTDTILKLEKNNTEARNLAAQLKDNVSKNRVGIKYDYTSFDKQFPDPWHLLAVDYTRQTRVGSFTGRINYANRFAKTGMQYELESYPIFSKTFYGYLNVGYSDDTIGVMPKWKGGGSLYANLPKAFETELGIRYLYFKSDVFVYTLYVGKYYKSFLFGARTYLTPNNTNIAQSYLVSARYYYGGIDDYFVLNLGTGISPDDRRINVLLNSPYKLRSYTGELVFRHAIRRMNIITANFSIINQEYMAGTIGNQYQAGIGYIRRF
jgi:Putative Zn-dependent protease, contains TPR repeats